VDGSIYVERPLASAVDVDRAVEKAVRAQKKWLHIPLAERQQLIHCAIDIFASQADDIAAELSWQMGRPISQGPGEITGLEERARYMIDIAADALANYRPAKKAGFELYIAREPIGVVAIIAPWNYPYLTAVNSIVPALVAGNAVVLKHASQTPLCAERFASVFAEAGLPDGVFQYLHLSHQNAERLMGDPRVGFVNFTGSVAAGHKVQRAISEKFIAAGLELGGKDPAYVREDADLDHAVENLVDGAFYNSGQSCCGIERIYVHESLYKVFVERFVALTQDSYVLGNPTDPATNLGPLVNIRAAEFVRGQISEALEAGASALIDETLFAASKQGTPYLAPQVLVNVNHSMRVMTEESFGPVVGIMSVSSDKEAITLMNDSEFGLCASVWTRDSEAAKTIGESVETGTFFMNRCDYLDPALAWTGLKDTGRGCSLSLYGYQAMTRLKSYHLRTQI